ncbi:histone PARylation factor 1-like isoform X2 [Dreissena polymorpha]|uniref:histone PARylation factor 1-like isoform X2 n=1 Tax=Dreissena polymorpha TaxID=45954 RepID=UPI002264917D|nr:histone PARylation factor 1-like isoform X2 [Dreissena polymorpha]
MASKLKPCKFAEKCYRKNPDHLKEYSHPKRKGEEVKSRLSFDKDDKHEKPPKKLKTVESKKANTIDALFAKNVKKEATVEEKPVTNTTEESESTSESFSATDKPCSPESGKSPQGKDEEDEATVESPCDVKENIKQKFLFEMPEDFYQFWEFCKAENPAKPTDALKKDTGLQLVGPYDILAGNHTGVDRNRHGRRPNFLLHWRYYYDPPEFQTVLKGDDKTQFHLGYFRDDPCEMPAFVAANSAAVDCIITPKGDNIFAAVSAVISDKLKAKDTDCGLASRLKDLSERLNKCATKLGLSLEGKSKRMKERDKKVVCKSFHKAGIVVPVDENEVGYREVPESPADLKKMFKKIADSKTDDERDKNYEDLQELITLIQFANDECDYGEGLELGMDLFCFGGSVFHSTILQLLPLAYMLLNRPEFGKIIEAHLKDRRKGADLSQIV